MAELLYLILKQKFEPFDEQEDQVKKESEVFVKRLTLI